MGKKKKSLMTLFFLITFMSVLPWSADAQTCTYYVSSSTGNDYADGLTDATAWTTINRVNQQSLLPGDTICFKRGDTWRLPTDDYPIIQSGDSSGYVTYSAYGSGPLPLFLGSMEKNDPSDWTLTSTPNVWTTGNNVFPAPVGNIIFNNEESTGRMVRGGGVMDQQGDYRVDWPEGQVVLYSVTTPGLYYSDLEFALKTYMFNLNGKSYVRLSNLDIRYGSGHGIWASGGAHHLIIEDNELSYIGGSMQDSSTRYGNAIELWSSTNNVYIERNWIHQVYDAALTSQGSGTNQMYNHYYRYNVIWDVRYCFEYWNRTSSSITDHIYFDNNTCVNSGKGFGENRAGSDLTFYENTAQTTNIYARNNIFYKAVGSSFGVADHPDIPWNGIENIVLDYNLYYKPSYMQYPTMIYYPPCWWEPLGRWLDCTYYTMDEFALYQADSGKDANSITADPLFVDEANIDFRPIEGSPACTASDSISYVGALPCVGIDTDTDNDGMPDDFEILYGLNPYDPSDAGSDNDSDGLSNLEEYNVGTNPIDSDTDNDNIADGIDNCPTSSPVNIAGTSLYFASIQPAYDAASNYAIVLSQQESLTEILNFGNDISITMRGGYDCSYAANTGKTVVKGEMKLSKGTIKIDSGSFKIE